MSAGLIQALGGAPIALSAGDWVDLGCAAVALISVALGAHRGLSAELPLGVGTFCGLLTAWHAYAPIHALYQDLSFLEDEREFLFILTAGTVILLIWLVAFLVSRGLRLLAVAVEKKPVDYVLGTVVGVIRAILILLIATALMLSETLWQQGRDVFCHQSRAGRMFSPWAATLLVTVKKLHPHLEIPHRTGGPGDISEPAK